MMIVLDDFFKGKRYNKGKLIEYGFLDRGEYYTKEFLMLEDSFLLRVDILKNGSSRMFVYDRDTQEIFLPIYQSRAVGTFVTTVQEACQLILSEVTEYCFDRTETQVLRVMTLIKKKYNIEPTFPFKKYPLYAAFKTPFTNKWFALVMTIDASKLDLNKNGTVDIVNVKIMPDALAQRIDNISFFPAYHMNKTHWYSICLDECLSDETILLLIEQSYTLVENRYDKSLKWLKK
ncbi:MmcQ/YjbR family DNA-binding protein [Carnobacteriaceae bacterium zg-84]|uniref:MmcQ/YjbR family DNA-binding protein n=1 Tax=Granulicatella sp. zg-84 TaxID=2678503 RepID=UPI0013BEDD3E|nr:MmcQ/YjbR family DNA-binding protein [Granulicatella sp. zg-84]NEW66951.1 hypothetical protein [Granulicatella sp. zg-84]QMI85761.1 MmcQ/YjbR family DNA-binding protein [Carnobacteriaceae bacterium zg-84]